MNNKKQLIEELLECVKDAKDTETKITGLSMCAILMNEVLDEALTIPVVSFSLFDKVYMDSPLGIYTGVVKGVEESRVIIESHSPNGKGMMLADYDLSNNDWQKY